MTQEEKELLLKDLSARLPYHVRLKVWLKDGTTEEGPLDLEHNYSDVLLDAFYYNKIKDIKPYLRPMSSMTEEEKKEYKHLVAFSGSPNGTANFIDWLNKKMFAYRTIDDNDMFKLGLALEAPEDMYNLKE